MAGIATFKLTASPTFPTGASLKVFERSVFPAGRPQTGVGPGIAPLQEVVVDSHGFALFGALEPNTQYIAGAEVEGVWRYISFETGAGTEATAGGLSKGEVEGLIAAAVKAVPAPEPGGTSNATGKVSLENGERPLAASGEAAATENKPRAVVVSPDGRHVYVTNQESKTVTVYAWAAATGLALIGSAALGASSEPKGIAVSPSGKFVYVADWGEKKIYQYSRNRYTGELAALSPATVSVAAAAAKVNRLVVSPDEKHLYATSEEASAEKRGLFQYEVKTGGELTALTPESPVTAEAGTRVGFANSIAISPDGKSVYVGYEGGIREWTRTAATGLLSAATARGVAGAGGAIVVSADNESLYVIEGSNTVGLYSRNTGTGVITTQGTKTVTGASGLTLSPDKGRTLYVTSSTENKVFGFSRSKPATEWELTALETPGVETEAKPLAVAVNPDALTAYVICETPKTLQVFSRSVQVKVESPYVRAEGPIDVFAEGEGVSGSLKPIKRVGQTSFYVSCSNPTSTGKVSWEMSTEGPTSAAVERSATLAILAALTKEQDLSGNVRPYTTAIGRWDMSDLGAHPAHPLSANIIEAVKEGSREKSSEPNSAAKISKCTLLSRTAAADFGSPFIFGKSTDAAYTVKDEFTKQTLVHIPSGALTARAEGDHDLSILDLPTGRVVNLGGPTFSVVGSTITLTQGGLSAHDWINGPAYSTNRLQSEAGQEIALEGAAAVAGSTLHETGGGSSARIDKTGFTIRAKQLEEADTAPFGPPMMMRATVRGAAAGTGGASAPAGAGMAPRSSSLFGEGVVLAPGDGRTPYIDWSLAHQGEQATNASSNVYALPNGAILRLKPSTWTEEHIEAQNCPNWVKWILWCLRSRGTVVMDVQGQPGLELCRAESLRSYSYRADPYYENWLKQHAKSDGLFCVENGEGWRLDITGGGVLTAALWKDLEVVVPPSKPAGLAF